MHNIHGYAKLQRSKSSFLSVAQGVKYASVQPSPDMSYIWFVVIHTKPRCREFALSSLSVPSLAGCYGCSLGWPNYLVTTTTPLPKEYFKAAPRTSLSSLWVTQSSAEGGMARLIPPWLCPSEEMRMVCMASAQRSHLLERARWHPVKKRGGRWLPEDAFMLCSLLET